MTKKEEFEKLLREIPCLKEDYESGKVRRYYLFGRYELSAEELSEAKNVIRGGKLLCVIQQDVDTLEEQGSLINYVVDEKDFTPAKSEHIDFEALGCSVKRKSHIEDFKQTVYSFQAYSYNATWNQYKHGVIGIMPAGNTLIRVW